MIARGEKKQHNVDGDHILIVASTKLSNEKHYFQSAVLSR